MGGGWGMERVIGGVKEDYRQTHRHSDAHKCGSVGKDLLYTSSRIHYLAQSKFHSSDDKVCTQSHLVNPLDESGMFHWDR